jgi:TolA-binding protein
MPSSPATTTPVEDSEFDAHVFWIQHKTRILLFVGLVIAALAIYAATEYVGQRRNANAQAAYATAKTTDDFRKIAADYSGTITGGNAQLILADKLRADGKLDDSSAALRAFIEKYPSHPLISGAYTSLGANLESQGKLDEALTTYQKVSSAYANSFSAPLALLAQARVLAEKNKPDDARRVYEQIISQYQDNLVSQLAGQELRKLKK